MTGRTLAGAAVQDPVASDSCHLWALRRLWCQSELSAPTSQAGNLSSPVTAESQAEAESHLSCAARRRTLEGRLDCPVTLSQARAENRAPKRKLISAPRLSKAHRALGGDRALSFSSCGVYLDPSRPWASGTARTDTGQCLPTWQSHAFGAWLNVQHLEVISTARGAAKTS